MQDKEFEKYIARLSQNLPRKQARFDMEKAKEKIWLILQNHIRSTRLVKDAGNRWAVFSLRFSKKALVVMSVFIFAGLAGGATQASKGSLPGDTLYPVKTTVEKLEKTLANSQEEKVSVLKEHTQTRLKEVELLAKEKKADDTVFNKTLDALKATSQELKDVATAVSEENPQIVDEVIELAEQEELVLAGVSQEVQNEAARDKILELINITRESSNRLRESQERVKAAQEDSGDEETSATSTPAQTQRAGQNLPGADEKIKSGIQIDEVIKSEDINQSSKTDDSSNEPKIINEPGL